MKRSRLVVPILLLAFSLEVACSGKQRHLGVVSVVSAHATLSTIQDVEVLLVCGRDGAPDPPTCVPLEKHREISGLLAEAFKLDGDIAAAVKSVRPGEPLPAQVPGLLASLSKLITDIVALIPDSSQKAALQSRIGG